jgi:spore coat protein CotH
MYRLALITLLLACQGPAYAQTTEDFFNPAVLHRIELTLHDGDWERLKENYERDDYYTADLRWNGITARRVGIRSRGSGSRRPTKPGLRIDIDRFIDDQTFLGLTSIILDNMAQDASGIRERLAMRFYERMGLPAAREAHAQLFVNDEYAGLVVIVESIDKQFLTRTFRRPDGGVDNDGHLFEYEYESAWNLTYLGPGFDAYARLFDPVTHENAPAEALYGPIEAMVRAINETPDATFVQEVSRYLDLKLFMRHVAVQAFLAEWDGVLGYAGVNNFYLYRGEEGSRSQFIPWDDDNAFRSVDFTILQGHQDNVLMRRAMQVPELRAAYFDALLSAAASATEGGWLEQEVQQQSQLIAEVIRADERKFYTNAEFDAAIDDLVDFARRRPGIVRCEVAKIVEAGSASAECAD